MSGIDTGGDANRSVDQLLDLIASLIAADRADQDCMPTQCRDVQRAVAAPFRDRSEQANGDNNTLPDGVPVAELGWQPAN